MATVRSVIRMMATLNREGILTEASSNTFGLSSHVCVCVSLSLYALLNDIANPEPESPQRSFGGTEAKSAPLL